MRIGVPLVDITTGLYAAIGILMALSERQKSGLGQFLETTLYETGLAIMHPHAANISCTASRRSSPATNIRISCPMRSFRPGPTTSSSCPAMTATFRKLAKEIGKPELGTDPRFARNKDRIANRDALRVELAAVFSQHDAAPLCDRLLAAGLPAGPVQSIDQALTSAHTVHRGDVIEKDWYRGVASPIRLQRSKPSLRSVPPKFSEHATAVLSEFGYSGRRNRGAGRRRRGLRPGTEALTLAAAPPASLRPRPSPYHRRFRRSFARHRALLPRVIMVTAQGGRNLMPLRPFAAAAAIAATLALATPACAVTEIQWWHAMTGPNNDVVVKLASDFNASQSDYRIVPSFKGGYADTLNAGIAAFRAGRAPGILQVFEVGTATMMAARGAIKPVSELMKEQGEAFDPQSYLPAITGYYSTSKGEMLSLPFNSSSMVMWINLDVLQKAGIAEPPKTWPDVFADAKNLHATNPTCGFFHWLDHLGAD